MNRDIIIGGKNMCNNIFRNSVLIIISIGVAVVSCSCGTQEKERGKLEAQSDSSVQINTGDIEQYEIKDVVTHFYNGKAWVIYTDGEYKRNYGVIDTSGNLLCAIPEEKQSYSDLYLDLTSFAEGSSWIHSGKDWILIDSKGNETGRLTDLEHGQYHIYCNYNDRYLVSERVESFSESSEYMYIINQYGEIVSDKVVYDRDCWDLSDGLNIGGIDGVYLFGGYLGRGWMTRAEAPEDGNFSYIEDLGGYILLADLRNDVLCDFSKSDMYYLKKTIDDLYDSIWEYCDGRIEYDLSYIDFWRVYNKNGMLIRNVRNANEYRAYDETGNVKFSGKLPEKVSLNGIFFPFYNDGCVPIYMEGADDWNYYTVLDGEGNMLYDPIKEYEYREWDWMDYDKGFLAMPLRIITPTGEILDEESDWVNIPSDVSVLEICEGFKYDTDCFVSLDGSVRIDSVIVRN